MYEVIVKKSGMVIDKFKTYEKARVGGCNIAHQNGYDSFNDLKIVKQSISTPFIGRFCKVIKLK